VVENDDATNGTHRSVNGNPARLVTAITSAGRVAAGAWAFARPEGLARAFGVDRGTARRAAVLMRLFAAREAALGLGALYALGRGRDVTPWVLAQALGDAGDAVAFAAATRARHVGLVRGAAVTLAATGGVLSAAWAVRDLRR
jgi:hypothetical protein